MSKAKNLIISLNEDRQRELVQYSHNGNASKPIGVTTLGPKLEAGIYNVGVNMEGTAIFEKASVKSDELLRFKSAENNKFLEEFRNFWTVQVKEKMKSHGMTHKRGFLWEGKPGTGKSCELKILMEDMVAQGDVVFLCKSLGDLRPVLSQFKEVEADRQVAVVIEELDKKLGWDEGTCLSDLMDGPDSLDGVFYLATTNHKERIPERMLRKSRFDRVIHVGFPSYENRLEYLKSKLGITEAEDIITELATATHGKSYADMKDMIVSIYCYGYDKDTVLSEMGCDRLIKTGSNIVSESLFNYKLKESMSTRKGYGKNITPSIARTIGNIWGTQVNIVSIKESKYMNTSKSFAKRIIEEVGALNQTTDLDTPSVVERPAFSIINTEDVSKSLTKRLEMLNILNVSIDSVESDNDGNIFVDFADIHGNVVCVAFSSDEQGRASAIILDPETDAEVCVIDLDNLGPTFTTTEFGQYMNLCDTTGWLNKSTLLTILMAGELDSDSGKPSDMTHDAFGNIVQATPPIRISNTEAHVGRGKSKLKYPIVHREKKNKLGHKQRIALKHKSKTEKKLARSIKLK